MALKFHPNQGTVVLCDYRTGFVVPEMVKMRPVVILSPRFRRRQNLCTVVPLSSQEPDPIEPYHHAVRLSRKLPKPWGAPYYWAKSDMVATVAFSRLHLIGDGRDPETGKRKYITDTVSDEDFQRIQECVRRALGV